MIKYEHHVQYVYASCLINPVCFESQFVFHHKRTLPVTMKTAAVFTNSITQRKYSDLLMLENLKIISNMVLDTMNVLSVVTSKLLKCEVLFFFSFSLSLTI